MSGSSAGGLKLFSRLSWGWVGGVGGVWGWGEDMGGLLTLLASVCAGGGVAEGGARLPDRRASP